MSQKAKYSRVFPFRVCDVMASAADPNRMPSALRHQHSKCSRLPLHQQHVMSFGIVEHCPCTLTLHKSPLAKGADGRAQIVNLKEQHRFVVRWIRLRAFAFQANEACAALELGIACFVLVHDTQSEHIGVKVPSSL